MATKTTSAGRTKKAKTKKKAASKKKASTKRKTTGKSKASKAKSGPAASISKADFRKKAELLQVEIVADGERTAEFDLEPREFSSGSFGWFASEKVSISVGGKRVRCQVSLNVTVIGSKNA